MTAALEIYIISTDISIIIAISTIILSLPLLLSSLLLLLLIIVTIEFFYYDYYIELSGQHGPTVEEELSA